MKSSRARTPTEIARVREATRAIGLKIRALRLAAGWTLEQASEAIDLDPRHLQRVETGVVSPSASTLLRIADALGVPVSTLVDTIPLLEQPPKHPALPAAVGQFDDPDTMPTRVGRHIAMLRRERGRTQALLASEAGLTEQYVQRVESGLQNPSLKVLARLARALGVALPEVVRVEESRGDPTA